MDKAGKGNFSYVRCFSLHTVTHGNDESPLAFGIDRIIDTTIGIVVALFINQFTNVKYSLTKKSIEVVSGETSISLYPRANRDAAAI